MKKIIEILTDEEKLKNLKDDMIIALIECDKELILDTTKNSDKYGHKVFSAKLSSVEDENIKFLFHIRESVYAPENTSVVLTLDLPEKNISLFRCNGPHAEKDDRDPLHCKYHTHTMSAEDIINQRLNHPTLRELAPYNNFLDSIDYCVKRCNIIDLEENLPKDFLPSNNLKQIGIYEITKKHEEEEA